MPRKRKLVFAIQLGKPRTSFTSKKERPLTHPSVLDEQLAELPDTGVFDINFALGLIGHAFIAYVTDDVKIFDWRFHAQEIVLPLNEESTVFMGFENIELKTFQKFNYN